MKPCHCSLLLLFSWSTAASRLWEKDENVLCSVVHYCYKEVERWMPCSAPGTTLETASYSMSCTDYTVCDRTTTTSSLSTTICTESTTSPSAPLTTCTETTASPSPCTDTSSPSWGTSTCSESLTTPYDRPTPTPSPLGSSDTCTDLTAAASVSKYTASKPYVLTEHV